MSTLDSILEQVGSLVDDKDPDTAGRNIFNLLSDYYTSSDVTDDYQKAVKQLDTTSLDENYPWLLFTGFELVTIPGLYDDAHRDKLCHFFLPIYECMLKELVPTETIKAQHEDTDHLPLNAIKYLISNMIQMQQTKESVTHILKTFRQFLNFKERDEYFSIIKIVLPLLINQHILKGIEKDNRTNIKFRYKSNKLSNTTNVTPTFIMWIILKLILMFIKTDGDCLTIMKHDQNVKDILLKSMKQIRDNHPIKLSLYAALAFLMNEQDIKNELDDPKQIIKILINNINQGIECKNEAFVLTNNGVHVIDLIVALKAFLQHDQVKNGFIEDNGLELLIELTEILPNDASLDFDDSDDSEAEKKPGSEPKSEPEPESKPEPESESESEPEPNPEDLEAYAEMDENINTDTVELLKEIGLLALECLFVMLFNKEAIEVLKKNEKFMSRLRKLADENNVTPTKNERLKKTLDGMLWKLEGEDQFKKQQQETTNTKENNDFDMMISYSWSDKPLVHEIYKCLTEKFNYHIWLDENQMAGSLCQAMAQAVEKSKFVLMCMSETYKGSENCRNEAEYARDRKKTIIPLIMKNVERDGWLGFISAGKMYIDFTKQDFDKAIHLLNTEIERNQREKGEQIQSIKPREKSSAVNVPVPQITVASVPITTRLPVRPNVISNAYKKIPIESWSEEHVQNFLYDNKLDVMILLTEYMNGEELHLLLQKCQSEQDCWIMFDRLNTELEKLHQQTLQISLYLRFLNQTQKYINSSVF